MTLLSIVQDAGSWSGHLGPAVSAASGAIASAPDTYLSQIGGTGGFVTSMTALAQRIKKWEDGRLLVVGLVAAGVVVAIFLSALITWRYQEWVALMRTWFDYTFSAWLGGTGIYHHINQQTTDGMPPSQDAQMQLRQITPPQKGP